MMVEIQGKTQDEELVEIYLVNLTKKLGLARRKTGEITVNFVDRMPKGYGDSLGLCEGDRQ